MKTKILLLAIFSLAICHTTEAQFLKKLKKTAERAAERTVLKKTDQIVTDKTDKTIDDVADGSDEKPDATTEAPNPNQQNGQINSNSSTKNTKSHGAFSSGNASANLPDQYEFNWEFKTVISSGKDDMGEINYLINSNTTDYFGMEMTSEELKGQGKMYMVMDNKQKANVMFMNMNGQKMGQIHKIPKPKKGKNESNMGFKEIGTKEILGYTCYGIEVEDKNYIGNLYFTLDAPVNFSAFFAMANNKNAPKGFDPALLQVLKEDALLMEMTMTHKQKSKENYKMTALSLEEKNTELSKKDYQFMKMGF